MSKTAWCLQQVAFEGPGVFRRALENAGYHVHQTIVPTEGLPPQGQIDFLLILGGPMSVNDPDSWIAQEVRFVASAIAQGIPVVGICFGAQLLAKVLGGTVGPGPKFEIGMVPVALTDEGKADPVFRDLPDSFSVFQWHGEGISLASTGLPLAASQDFPIQAFRHQDRVYGLLFHPEIEANNISVMCQACPQDVLRGGVSEDFLERQTQAHLPFLHQVAHRIVAHLTSLSSAPLNS